MSAEFESFAGSWLLTYLLHSTLLLGLAWLISRRSSETPARRELVWKAALLGGLVTATVQTVLPFEPLSGVVSLARDRASAGQAQVPALPADLEAITWAGIRPGSRPADSLSGQTGLVGTPASLSLDLPVRPSPAAAAGGSLRGLSLALWGWMAIGGGLFLRFLLQRHRAMRGIGPRRPVDDPALLALLAEVRRAGAVRGTVRLTRASGLASPVALGWSEIVLPEAALTDLDAAQQKCLLAHELAHLVRRDPFWLAIGCGIERLFFFQPLNRLARIRLQEAAEYLCDDWAVRRTGSGVSLATCLLKVAEWITTPPQPVPLAGMAERRSQLVIRIHRLIEGRTMNSAPRTLWLAAGTVALLGITVVAAPGVAAHAQQPVAADTTAADSTESAYRRLLRRMRIGESRMRADSRRALNEARRAALAPHPLASTSPVAPEPAMAPLPPGPPMATTAMAVARAEMMRSLSNARVHAAAELALLRGQDRGRGRDTNNIAVPALISALKDQDVEVRRAAAEALANLQDPRAVPGLIGALEDRDAEVRGAAAMALGSLEDRRAVSPLLALLKDPSVEVRHQALGALGNFPDGVPADAILAAMNDGNSDIRHVAMSLALSQVGERDEDTPTDPRFIAAFSRLLKDPSEEIRQVAVSGLAEMRLTQAPAELLALERDRSEDVRQQVAHALGRIGDPKGVPVLKNLLADQSADVREAAVNGLGEIRDRSALEALVAALRSTDPVVRRHAAMALGQRDEE